jgi:tRNA pseudouridine38-40 synthase
MVPLKVRANRTILLTVAYDGTSYAGWQRQGDRPTIQLSLEKALHSLLQEKVSVVCAGRTDSGVHALGNCAHFKTISRIKPQNLLKGANALLPRDIRIVKVEDRPEGFHARYDAVRRWYRYHIYNNRISSPFWERYALFHPYPLDPKRIGKALRYLVGEHDFTSFCALQDESRNRVRRIYHIRWRKQGSLHTMDVVGSGFLHNMIRIIVGTALMISKDQLAPERMKEILEAKDRTVSGMTVPPQGLFLMKVTYKEDLTWLNRIMPVRECRHSLFSPS